MNNCIQQYAIAQTFVGAFSTSGTNCFGLASAAPSEGGQGSDPLQLM